MCSNSLKADISGIINHKKRFGGEPNPDDYCAKRCTNSLFKMTVFTVFKVHLPFVSRVLGSIYIYPVIHVSKA